VTDGALLRLRPKVMMVSNRDSWVAAADVVGSYRSRSDEAFGNAGAGWDGLITVARADCYAGNFHVVTGARDAARENGAAAVN